MSLAVLFLHDRLVRGILAGCIAAPALDAEILVDVRLGDVIEIEILPIGHIGHCHAPEVINRGIALFVHPARQARSHLLDDAKAIGHGCRAHLRGARRHGDEFRRIAPGGDAADRRDGKARRFLVAGDFRNHGEGDGLHRRAAIAAVAALAVNGRFRREAVEIDRGDGIDGVDERDRVRSTLERGASRAADVRDVGRELDDHRHARVLLAPARHHLDVFRYLAHRRTHAALRHSVRTAEVEFNAICFSFFHLGKDLLPRLLLARHHERDDNGTVRPVLLDLLDLAEVDLKRAVGDQFDVVEAEQPAVRPMYGAIARTVDVDDRRPFLAERLPHHATPARLEGAHHIVFLVGGRSRSQPERVG